MYILKVLFFFMISTQSLVEKSNLCIREVGPPNFHQRTEWKIYQELVQHFPDLSLQLKNGIYNKALTIILKKSKILLVSNTKSCKCFSAIVNPFKPVSAIGYGLWHVIDAFNYARDSARGFVVAFVAYPDPCFARFAWQRQTRLPPLFSESGGRERCWGGGGL